MTLDEVKAIVEQNSDRGTQSVIVQGYGKFVVDVFLKRENTDGVDGMILADKERRRVTDAFAKEETPAVVEINVWTAFR